MNVTLLGPLSEGGQKLPFYSVEAFAGLGFPADDHIKKYVSLGELLGVREPHSYMARIEDDSMQGAGMFPGDLVVVDRSLYAEHGHIVLAEFNSQQVCARLHMLDDSTLLKFENSKYPPRQVMACDELVIKGVVKHSLRNYDRPDGNMGKQA